MRASHASTGARFVCVVAAATAFVVLLLVLDGSVNKVSGAGDMRLFQRAVGGLGMGAAATPAWNLLHFDPRLQGVDDSNLWPVPGSYPYNPSAVSTAVSFREVPREDLRIIRIRQ